MHVELLNIPLPEDLLKLKWHGNFKLMSEMIDIRIQKDIPQQLKDRLLLEKEIIRRLPADFIYTKNQAIALCQHELYDFTAEEFDELFKDNAFEFLFVEGIMKFKDNFFDNLIKSRPIYQKRLKHNRLLQEDRDEIIEHIKKKKDVYYRFHVKMAIKIKPQYEEIGKRVRVWLPLPLVMSPVEAMKVIKTSSSQAFINDDTVLQRSVYFEEILQHDQEFAVEFEIYSHVHDRDLTAKTSLPVNMNEYLQECQPHIVFTPYLKQLTKSVIGNTSDPLQKAKRIYDYITSHITYSFVRSYLTLPCLSEYMATAMKGDCGIYAILFITLCRIAGIPATWQSGLYCTPQHISNHDWAMFYVEPYGWLHCDCSFGGSGFRHGSDRQRQFYFGHIDPFRIPFAGAFMQELVPPKKFIRRDPFDHQTGEIEYDYRAINEYEYDMYQTIIEAEEINKTHE